VNYKTELAPNGDNPNEAFFPFEENYNFFNPKFGFNFHVNRQNTIYFYYGMAHREPIRSDFMDNGKILKPEKMQDFELGYKKSGRWNFNANLYYMYYLDQLVATGQLNDVGGFMRTNSGKSYRTGIEIQTQYDVIPDKLKFFGNATYSINKNLNYNEIGYDENGNEVLEKFGDTDISFSPDLIASFGINYVPAKNLNLNLSNKYVSEQYLTNTELADGRLDSYFLTDVLINYSPNWLNLKNLEFSLLINNIFDVEYESNGFYYEGAYYYPQAGINILGGLKLRL